MAWLCVPDLSSRALAAAFLQRPEEQNPDATSLQWLCWDDLSWRLPVSEGKTSPGFRATRSFPKAHGGLAVGLVAGSEGLRMSKSEHLPPGLGVTVRAGQVHGCPSWLPGCELLQGGLTLRQCPNVQRTFPVWEALPLPRGGVPPGAEPSTAPGPHHCERVLCSPVSPHPSSSSLQALLHKDAPHADRHRVQVRLPRLLVSVRLQTSSDSLRTLFKDYDFGRDTAVTKLVALWWELASQAPRQLWCLWYYLWTLGFERLP